MYRILFSGFLVLFLFVTNTLFVFAEEIKHTPEFSMSFYDPDDIDIDKCVFDEVQPGDVLDCSYQFSFFDTADFSYIKLDLSLANSGPAFETKIPVSEWVQFNNLDYNSVILTADESFKLVDSLITIPEDMMPGDYSIMIQALLSDYEGKELASHGFVGVSVKLAVGSLINFSIPGEVEEVESKEFKGEEVDGEEVDGGEFVIEDMIRSYDTNFMEFTYSDENLDKGELELNLYYYNDSDLEVYPYYEMVISKDDTTIYEIAEDLPLCLSGTSCGQNLYFTDLDIKPFEKINLSLDFYYKIYPDSDKVFVANSNLVIRYYPEYFTWVFLSIVLSILIIYLFVVKHDKT